MKPIFLTWLTNCTYFDLHEFLLIVLGKEGKRHALASSNGLNGNDGTIPTPPQPAKDHSHVLGNIDFNHFESIKRTKLKTEKPSSLKGCANVTG